MIGEVEMQVSVLASGSKGNAVYVEMDGVRLLIDAGISATRIKKGLAAEGIFSMHLLLTACSSPMNTATISQGSRHSPNGIICPSSRGGRRLSI
ncbi:MAG: hypothetical protein ACFWTM_07145 [Mitsuokella multacida]